MRRAAFQPLDHLRLEEALAEQRLMARVEVDSPLFRAILEYVEKRERVLEGEFQAERELVAERVS